MLLSIQSTEELRGHCRKQDAWLHIIDFANYPKLIPQVDSVRIIENCSGRMRLEWSITLDGAPFSWIEVVELKPEQYVIQSEAVSGDFDVFKGKWQIEDNNDGIKLSYFLDYELGIPVIEEHCWNILKSKLQKYIDNLVIQHGSIIQKHSSELRKFRRVSLNRFYSFNIDGRSIEANIINLSRGGMMINLLKGMLGTDPSKKSRMKMGDVSVCGRILFDKQYKAHRILFDEPLDEDDFKSVLTVLTGIPEISDETVKIYEVMTAQQNGVSKGSPKTTKC